MIWISNQHSRDFSRDISVEALLLRSSSAVSPFTMSLPKGLAVSLPKGSRVASAHSYSDVKYPARGLITPRELWKQTQPYKYNVVDVILLQTFLYQK
jgi:hypothetical protein